VAATAAAVADPEIVSDRSALRSIYTMTRAKRFFLFFLLYNNTRVCILLLEEEKMDTRVRSETKT